MTFYNATSDGVVELSAEESVELQERIDGGLRDESAAFDIRSERNAKLSATDWTASTDVTMTAEMTTYRQALRDIPSQVGFPTTITWPEAP
tara:strand:+ start:1166 stop:1438 length:273 start_codon:yes stop_codon:yes gene_type:complete